MSNRLQSFQDSSKCNWCHRLLVAPCKWLPLAVANLIIRLRRLRNTSSSREEVETAEALLKVHLDLEMMNPQEEKEMQ
jgi:hypothetical protein